MGADDRVVLVKPDGLASGPPTPGMDRRQAFATDDLWAGLATTGAGMVSGWHHHGGYESVIYVVSGALRMEFGPGGAQSLDAGPGDFLLVPKGLVHREGNPSEVPAGIVVVRAGRGESTINVPGPDPG
jgi:uncharacterized RmlC-like cupin family protein